VISIPSGIPASRPTPLYIEKYSVLMEQLVSAGSWIWKRAKAGERSPSCGRAIPTPFERGPIVFRQVLSVIKA
jgi:transposase